MTGETLGECPFCGSTDLYNAYPKSAAECGVIACRGCGAEGPDAGPPDRHIAAWQSRALGPALDTVIAEVENDERDHFEYTTPARNENDYVWRAGKEHILGVLHALRAEQSTDAGGERGGGDDATT